MKKKDNQSLLGLPHWLKKSVEQSKTPKEEQEWRCNSPDCENCHPKTEDTGECICRVSFCKRDGTCDPKCYSCQPSENKEESMEVSSSEKIATLLKHDTNCAVDKAGVCDCWFYDVANRLVKLSSQEISKAVAKEREELMWGINGLPIVLVDIRFDPDSKPKIEQAVLLDEVLSLLNSKKGQE